MGSEPLTRAALLREAERRQLSISGPKLDRWVRRGLVPAPQTKNLGGRAGRESIYAATSLEQIAAVSEALLLDRRLDCAALLLWWRGFDIALPVPHRFLTQIAEEMDQEILELRSLIADGSIYKVIEDSGTARIRNKVAGRARRRVGRASFPAVFRIMTEVATGCFSELHTDFATDEDEGLLFERALGMARARTDPLPDGSDPWLEGPPEANLRDLSSIMSNPLAEVVNAATDEELTAARDEAVPIVDLLAAIAPVLEHAKGKDAYGIAELGRVLGEMTPKDLAQFVVVWLRLRTDPKLQPGIEELSRAAKEALVSLEGPGIPGESKASDCSDG